MLRCAKCVSCSSINFKLEKIAIKNIIVKKESIGHVIKYDFDLAFCFPAAIVDVVWVCQQVLEPQRIKANIMIILELSS